MPQFDAYDEATSADTGDLFLMDDVSAGATKKIKAENMPGGSGTVREIVVAFAFDTPNILTGAAVYTPAIGDTLLDAWIEVVTAWNGTSPNGDVGQFTSGDLGWFNHVNAAIDMTAADSQAALGATMLAQATSATRASGLAQASYPSAPQGTYRAVPAKFTTSDPVKVCVSQGGVNDGADPGSSQGAAVLHLLVSTPTTPESELAGASIVRKFPFAFDTPNLLTGAALYTPTAGDILLNAWIQIDTVWNGTTPKGDIGTFTGDVEFTGGGGLFGSLDGGPLAMTLADVSEYDPGYLSPDPDGTRNPGLVQGVSRIAPGKIMTADPIKVCVSQDGTNIGADPGSSQGSAVLYLVTATPI